MTEQVSLPETVTDVTPGFWATVREAIAAGRYPV